MSKSVVLSGYYGFHNAGDDAILAAILEALKEECPRVAPVVLSNDPDHTRIHYGVRAVNRWQPSDVINALTRADLLVSGGGSLLQDVTSRHGMLYYLGVLSLAQRLKVPTMVYAQGVGPIRYASNQRATAKVFNHTKVLTVRDRASKDFLESIGVTRPIIQTADPVLGLVSQQVSQSQGESVLKAAGWKGDRPTFLVCLRPWKEEDRVRIFARAFDQVVAAGYEVAFLAMQPSQDGPLAMAIQGHMEEESVVLADAYDAQTLMGIFMCADMVVGMRLHALIFGAASCKPLLALSYDVKVDAFMDQVGQDRILPIDYVTPALLVDQALSLANDQGIDPAYMTYLARLAKLPAKMAAAAL